MIENGLKLDLKSSSNTITLKQPKEIFVYSRTIDGSLTFEQKKIQNENVPHFYFPDNLLRQKKYNLSSGFSKFHKIEEEKNISNIQNLLKGIVLYEKNQNNEQKISADLICYRSQMRQLLTLHQNLDEEVIFNIVAFDGHLIIDTDKDFELKKIRQKRHSNQKKGVEFNDYLKKCEYGGYKFETITTLKKPWSLSTREEIEKRDTKIVNNYEQFISVIKTGISNVSMIMGGEVDCVWDYLPTSSSENTLLHYAELKTSKTINNESQLENFENKLYNAWAQCFLLGITKVVYGFRDENFILRSIEVYKTDEIPLLLKNNFELKKKNTDNLIEKKNKTICIKSLRWYGAVLNWITNSISKVDHLVSWQLSYTPKSLYLFLTQLSEKKNFELRNGKLLSKEFIEWRKKEF